MNEHKRIEDKRKSRLYSSKASKLINLDDDNIEAPEPASLKRPIGRKAEKEAIKKAKVINQVGEDRDESSKVRIELEELRARRIENERIRAEQFQQLLATEQKHVELKEKKLELQDRNEEDRIMAMDTSGVSPIQVEYFDRRRKEIF